MAHVAPATGPVDYLCDPVPEQFGSILTDPLFRALAGTKLFYGTDWKLRLNPASKRLIKPVLPLSLMAFFESLKEKVSAAKGKLLVAVSLGSVTLVQYASAATLNESIAPILTSVTELFDPLLQLILAAIPLIIALSVSNVCVLPNAPLPGNRVRAWHLRSHPCQNQNLNRSPTNSH
jgi:hypothetical protein